ncbi:MAG: hypothetical protein II942_03405 [Alphaproteobacteria bacterium]|nr:hypothetical protein [Alphaproteobacteria bacterium]
MTSFLLPFPQNVICLAIGFGLAVLYLVLLHFSIKLLKTTKHPGILLVLSAVVRLAVLLALSIYLSFHDPIRFIWIIIGFIITKFILLSFVTKKGGHK